jgi:hypothetical protein
MKNNDTSLSSRSLSPFAAIRVEACAIWRGPKNIEVSDSEGVSFYGWPTLSLEVTTGQTDRVESRTMYANLFDDLQHFAILRAVNWDGRLIKKTVVEQGENFKLMLPARFVKIPVEWARTWLSEFDGMNVAINEVLSDDNTVDIRRLRIEQDYKTCVFEKIWQTHNSSYAPLNQKWDGVWRQMTGALTNEPLVTDFDEDFWFVNPEIVYDLQTYQPDWFTLR